MLLDPEEKAVNNFAQGSERSVIRAVDIKPNAEVVSYKKKEKPCSKKEEQHEQNVEVEKMVLCFVFKFYLSEK